MAHEFATETESASSSAGATSSVVSTAAHATVEMSREDIVAAADAKADRTGILILFGAAMLFVLHFISGWTFDI